MCMPPCLPFGFRDAQIFFQVVTLYLPKASYVGQIRRHHTDTLFLYFMWAKHWTKLTLNFFLNSFSSFSIFLSFCTSFSSDLLFPKLPDFDELNQEVTDKISNTSEALASFLIILVKMHLPSCVFIPFLLLWKTNIENTIQIWPQNK